MDKMRKCRANPLIMFPLTLVLAIALAASLFHYLFSDLSRRQALMQAQLTLDSDAFYVDSVHDAVKSIFDSLSFDSDVSVLTNYDEPSASAVRRALDRLDSYVATSHQLDSIYIYDRDSGLVYASSPMSPDAVFLEADFFDQDALALMKDYSSYKNMEPIFRTLVRSAPYEDETGYISFMRYNTLLDEGSSDVMMANVRMDLFSELHDDAAIDDTRVLLLASAGGSFAYPISGRWWAYDEDSLAAAALMAVDDEDGRLDINGRKLLSCSKPVMGDWLDLVLVADEDSLAGLADTGGFTLTLFVLPLLFMLCCACTVWTIRSILRQKKIHDEEVRRLEAEKARHEEEDAMRRLESFLKGDAPLDGTGLALDADEALTLVRVQYSPGAARPRFHTDATPLFTIDDRYDGRFICYRSAEGGGVLGKLAQEARPFTIFVDECDAAGLPNAVQRLSSARVYRLLYPSSSIIRMEDIEEHELFECPYPEKEVRQLCQSLMKLDSPGGVEALDVILKTISQGTYRSFLLNLTQLVVTLGQTLSTVLVNNGLDAEVPQIDDLLCDLTRMDSIDSIRSILSDAIAQVVELVSSSKDGHQVKLVSQIQDHVKASYADKNFSMIDVADKLGMSASYLGKLFKRVSGQTFIEYLQSVRMEEARRLLADSDLEISQVVSAVGYGDVPYFYKIFKKLNGCTPLAYRTNHTGL